VRARESTTWGVLWPPTSDQIVNDSNISTRFFSHLHVIRVPVTSAAVLTRCSSCRSLERAPGCCVGTSSTDLDKASRPWTGTAETAWGCSRRGPAAASRQPLPPLLPAQSGLRPCAAASLLSSCVQGRCAQSTHTATGALHYPQSDRSSACPPPPPNEQAQAWWWGARAPAQGFSRVVIGFGQSPTVNPNGFVCHTRGVSPSGMMHDTHNLNVFHGRPAVAVILFQVVLGQTVQRGSAQVKSAGPCESGHDDVFFCSSFVVLVALHSMRPLVVALGH
jgi:hypothetical protein